MAAPAVAIKLAFKLPNTALFLKNVLDNLIGEGTLLSSAELAAHAGQSPVRAVGGYGGQIARLASIYLPNYTAKVKGVRYWGKPETIRQLNAKLGA